jgi:hypothetical protein
VWLVIGRRNRLEEEDDKQIWHDMWLALEEVAEGGWMPGSIGRLIELVVQQDLQHNNQQE